jgi:diguanylate cyclase (GGDEF)-like protein
MPSALHLVLRPGPLLLAAAILVARWARPDAAGAGGGLIALAPLAAALAGLLVAWPLRRSRLVFAMATLALGSALLSRWAPGDAVAYQAAACLVPLNLAAIALLPERGVFTPAGFILWIGLAVQAAITAVLVAVGARELAPDTLSRLLDVDGSVPATPIGRSALAAFLLSGAAMAGGRWFAPETSGRGYLWSLAGAFLAFHAGGDGSDRAVYLSAAAVILLIAAIEASYRLAYHDALTGLPGRRAFDEALIRLSGTCTVAMVDVDRFKQFNDTYGHDVGDQVLRTVAGRLRETLGEGKVFRYGGEEFAVLLPGATLKQSLSLLEAARAAVAAPPFAVRARIRPRKKPRRPRARRRRTEETVTVSIGAAEYGGRDTRPDQAIKAADQALYRAKQSGRNQVCA